MAAKSAKKTLGQLQFEDKFGILVILKSSLVLLGTTNGKSQNNIGAGGRT
jgi:hypothetical protein